MKKDQGGTGRNPRTRALGAGIVVTILAGVIAMWTQPARTIDALSGLPALDMPDSDVPILAEPSRSETTPAPAGWRGEMTVAMSYDDRRTAADRPAEAARGYPQSGDGASAVHRAPSRPRGSYDAGSGSGSGTTPRSAPIARNSAAAPGSAAASGTASAPVAALPAAPATGAVGAAGSSASPTPTGSVAVASAMATAPWTGNDELAERCLCSAEPYPFRYRRQVEPGTFARFDREAERRRAAKLSTIGEQRVAVLVAYSSNTQRPNKRNDDLAWEILDERNPRSFASYWREVSFGRFWITGRVYGPYDAGDARYSFDFVKNAVEAAHRSGNVDWAGVDRLYVLVPPGNGRVPGFRPMAAFGSTDVPAVELPDGRFVTAAVTMIDDRSMGVAPPNEHGTSSGGGRHEFGHTLGWGHQGHLDCPGAAYRAEDESSGCVVTNAQLPIGGISMGNGRTPTAPELERVGWTSPERVLTIERPGTYRVALGALSAPKGLNVVKIPRDDRGGHYYLEYRRPIGLFEADLWAHPWGPLDGPIIDLDAVQVSIEGRFQPGHGELSSIVLDMTPGDAPMPALRRGLNEDATFVCPAYGTRISVEAIDDTHAHLVIVATILPERTEGVAESGPAFTAYIEALADPDLPVESLIELLDAWLAESAGQ